MRFALAHKLSTYLMVVCSTCALVLSGSLGEAATLLSMAAIAASWLWEPPRVRLERYTRLWTAITVLAFVVSAADALAGQNLLVVGARFLLCLLAVKLFNRRACKDYQHIYVLTFLMLVAGTVLNAGLSYGVFFLGYVIAATWALTMFHLRREMEDNFLLKHSATSSERVEVSRILNSRRIVGGWFFAGTSMVSLSIFLAAMLMFLVIPRIGFGLFFHNNHHTLTLAGFSDDVKLGDQGVIKDDDTVVMRVKVSDKRFEGQGAPPLYWRGVAFDRYADGQWMRSRKAPRPHGQVELAGGGLHLFLQYARHRPSTPRELGARMAGAVRQEVYLEPLGYNVLFGASMPITFDVGGSAGRLSLGRNDDVRYRHSGGIKYVVYSRVDRPPPATLRAAPNTLPPGYGAYLEIPRDMPARVIALAHRITAGAATNYDKAVAIQRWLKHHLTYTRTMQSPPGHEEPIDFFLFRRKKGHCEYFASAMTILARAVGVPARAVNGFVGGDWNEYDDYIAVRAGDAHSWVEVFFPGAGWVTFDPTPSAGLVGPHQGGGLLDKLGEITDAIRFKWFKWVIEYDLYKQLSLFRRVGRALRGKGSLYRAPMARAKRWLRRHAAAAGLLLALAAALLALALVRRRHRRSQESGRPAARRRRRRGPIAAAYDRALRELGRRGHRRPRSATPREHAAALRQGSAPGADALAELAEIYYAAQYGDGDGDGAAGDEMRARAEALAQSISTALREARRR